MLFESLLLQRSQPAFFVGGGFVKTIIEIVLCVFILTGQKCKNAKTDYKYRFHSQNSPKMPA